MKNIILTIVFTIVSIATIAHAVGTNENTDLLNLMVRSGLSVGNHVNILKQENNYYKIEKSVNGGKCYEVLRFQKQKLKMESQNCYWN